MGSKPRGFEGASRNGGWNITHTSSWRSTSRFYQKEGEGQTGKRRNMAQHENHKGEAGGWQAEIGVVWCQLCRTVGAIGDIDSRTGPRKKLTSSVAACSNSSRSSEKHQLWMISRVVFCVQRCLRTGSRVRVSGQANMDGNIIV